MSNSKALYTAKELCEIVEVCAKCQVEKLSFGIVEICFQKKDPSFEFAPSGQTKPQEIPQNLNFTKPDNDFVKEELEERELDDLSLEDPLEYERRIAQRMIGG